VCSRGKVGAQTSQQFLSDQSRESPRSLQGLRDHGRIQPGQKVLVGASGGVGTFAIQIAKSFGAEATAVCSTDKMDTARSIGADHVIDYTREDFTKSAHGYDLILGANAHHSMFVYRRMLHGGGTYVAVGGGLPQIFESLLLARFLPRIGRKKRASLSPV
jgi:NADPH:quinone reductase-like Zn-dependent oxidoreductase